MHASCMSCKWHTHVWNCLDIDWSTLNTTKCIKCPGSPHQMSPPNSIRRFSAGKSPGKSLGSQQGSVETQWDRSLKIGTYGFCCVHQSKVRKQRLWYKQSNGWLAQDQAASFLLASLTCTTSISKPLLGYKLDGQSEASWVLDLASGSEQKWDCKSAWQNLHLHCSAVKTLRGKWNVN